MLEEYDLPPNYISLVTEEIKEKLYKKEIENLKTVLEQKDIEIDRLEVTVIRKEIV